MVQLVNSQVCLSVDWPVDWPVNVLSCNECRYQLTCNWDPIHLFEERWTPPSYFPCKLYFDLCSPHYREQLTRCYGWFSSRRGPAHSGDGQYKQSGPTSAAETGEDMCYMCSFNPGLQDSCRGDEDACPLCKVYFSSPLKSRMHCSALALFDTQSTVDLVPPVLEMSMWESGWCPLHNMFTKHTHTRTHARTHTHTQARTHTYTHTHTHKPI